MLPGGMVGYVEMALSVWFYLVASDKQTLVKKREREKSKQTYVISFDNSTATIDQQSSACRRQKVVMRAGYTSGPIEQS